MKNPSATCAVRRARRRGNEKGGGIITVKCADAFSGKYLASLVDIFHDPRIAGPFLKDLHFRRHPGEHLVVRGVGGEVVDFAGIGFEIVKFVFRTLEKIRSEPLAVVAVAAL